MEVELAPAKTFEDIAVWKKAHQFVLNVYRLSEQFPKHEIYGLTSQLRRAAFSIPANFAEGFRKMGKADKLRFYNIAQGPLEECRYYLILASDLNYAATNEMRLDLEEISKMLTSYMRKIRADF
jgi:four helix bundle protein